MSDEHRVLQAIVAAALLGFQPAKSSTLMRELNRITCSDTTAMRDSISLGIRNTIALNALFINAGLGGVYNFVHVILTDGGDTSSSTSVGEIENLFEKLGNEIPKELIRNVFIGIELRGNDRWQLQNLSRLGGDTSEIYDVEESEIESIFARIKLNLGLVVETQGIAISNGMQTALIERQQVHAVLQAQRQNYVVLFNIDCSGSMHGPRWTQTLRAINNFMNSLSDEDLVCGITFNNQVKCITQNPSLSPRSNNKPVVNQQRPNYQAIIYQQDPYQERLVPRDPMLKYPHNGNFQVDRCPKCSNQFFNYKKVPSKGQKTCCCIMCILTPGCCWIPFCFNYHEQKKQCTKCKTYW